MNKIMKEMPKHIKTLGLGKEVQIVFGACISSILRIQLNSCLQRNTDGHEKYECPIEVI